MAEVGGQAPPGEDEQGLGLAGAQPGHIGRVTGQERAPPARPAFGVDGDAGRRQGVEVAIDRPDRHFEPAGQVGRAQPAVGLEQEEQREEPVGLHGWTKDASNS